MKTGNKGVELIKKFEGCRLTAYKCPAGVWTIGYGHTGADVMEGLAISEQRAEELLRSDLAKFECAVSRNVTSAITQNQFDSLVSFTYNLGEGNLKKSTLLKKVNANPNDKSIEAEFPKWNKAGGTVLAGLVSRRAAESELYFTL